MVCGYFAAKVNQKEIHRIPPIQFHGELIWQTEIKAFSRCLVQAQCLQVYSYLKQ